MIDRALGAIAEYAVLSSPRVLQLDVNRVVAVIIKLYYYYCFSSVKFIPFQRRPGAGPQHNTKSSAYFFTSASHHSSTAVAP